MIKGSIPVMRVNYTIPQLIEAFFVSERTTKNRERLKEAICNYFAVNNVLLTSSARCAIYMIVKSLPQKKVVLPAYTCEVVIEAVRLAGKEVVFAHVSQETLNISEYPEIDQDTIVIATHQYGFLSDVGELMKICKEKGAVLIEDCAGSLGGRVDGKLTGTFGDYGVFSFSASKTLHSPTKGGFIIARSEELLEKIQPLSDLPIDIFSFKFKQLVKALGFCLAKNRIFSKWLFGMGESKSDHSDTAYLTDSSYHRGLYEWQAFVALKQFKLLDIILKERQRLFEKYDNQICNSLVKKYSRQQVGVNIRYPILVSERGRFIDYCKNNGVSVGTGYHRLYCPDSFETEKEISKQIVYLPFGNHYSESETDKVIAVVNSYK